MFSFGRYLKGRQFVDDFAVQAQIRVMVDTGCRVGAGMAQDLRCRFKVTAFAQDMGGKGMAESLRRESPCDARRH